MLQYIWYHWILADVFAIYYDAATYGLYANCQRGNARQTRLSFHVHMGLNSLAPGDLTEILKK